MATRDKSGRFTSRTTTVEQFVESKIVSLLSRRNAWSGTMTELQEAIVSGSRRNIPENFPKSPASLRLVVNRVLPRLRREGVRATFTRRHIGRIVELSRS